VSALPKQDNHCDCGLFVLAYMEYFVHANPPALSYEAVKNAKGEF
jgi:Ulp1 family protease